MRQPYVILTIAGSDPSGGAGIQADIKTISALGGYAASVITAVTAQNTLGVQDVFPLPPSHIKAQLDAVFEDLYPVSVKIGMIYDKEAASVIAETLERYRPQYVVYDPVMVSTSGRILMENESVEYIKKMVFPRCTLVTPNLHEASLLANTIITDTVMMKEFGREFTRQYRTDVLIKGGHLAGNTVKDILCKTDGTVHEYDAPKILTHNLHGTGCTLSSAIATFLTRNKTPEQAVQEAGKYINRAIQEASDWHIGHGNGPLCHFF